MNSSIIRITKLNTEEALLAKYESAFTAVSGSDAPLISQPDLAPLAAALIRRLHPATAEERTQFIALIGSAWPQAHQRVHDDTMELFTRQLEEELITFPADVLIAVLHHLRRSLKFLPSISEIYEAAVKLMDKRKSALRTVRRHQREHERRAEVVRKNAEDTAQCREETRLRLDRLTAIRGNTSIALTSEDLEIASAGMLRLGLFRAYEPWLIAIENRDPWAADVVPPAVVMGAAHHPYRRAQVSTAALCRSLNHVRRHPGWFRQAVIELYVDTPKDEADVLVHPDRLFAEIFEEIRRTGERQTAVRI